MFGWWLRPVPGTPDNSEESTMGLDDMKGKATDAVGDNTDKVEQGVDKAGEFAESKGADQEHVEKGTDAAKDKLGGLGGN